MRVSRVYWAIAAAARKFDRAQPKLSNNQNQLFGAVRYQAVSIFNGIGRAVRSAFWSNKQSLKPTYTAEVERGKRVQELRSKVEALKNLL